MTHATQRPEDFLERFTARGPALRFSQAEAMEYGGRERGLGHRWRNRPLRVGWVERNTRDCSRHFRSAQNLVSSGEDS